MPTETATPGPRLYRLREIAERTGFCRNSIEKEIIDKKLGGTKIRKVWTCSPEDLKKWLGEGRYEELFGNVDPDGAPQ